MKQPDYERYAEYYDFFELAGYEESEELNLFLNELFKINGVRTVLDFACGTGAQSIGLARMGYLVTAADISGKMLEIAQKKAAKYKKQPQKFVKSSMVDANLGNFDAVICIFNAIGHLDTVECRQFFKNAASHLHPGGIFVVDIFNLQALVNGAFAEYSYMSRELVVGGHLINHVRNCKLDSATRTIAVSSKTRRQDGSHRPEEIVDTWEMRVYDADELKGMLHEAGFNEIILFGATGTPFDPAESEVILALCQK